MSAPVSAQNLTSSLYVIKWKRCMQVDSTGRDPKSLPNDPQKQGNIWHRYEQLENATKSLSNVNQQLIDERAQHKKACQPYRSYIS